MNISWEEILYYKKKIKNLLKHVEFIYLKNGSTTNYFFNTSSSFYIKQ